MKYNLNEWGAGPSGPYPLYERLRAIGGVASVNLGDGRAAWLVTSYHDVVRFLHDPNLSRTAPDYEPPIAPEKLMRGAAGLLGRKAAERVRQGVKAQAEHCLGTLSEKGKLEVVSGLCFPVALRAFSTMLGIPASLESAFAQAVKRASPVGDQLDEVAPDLSPLRAFVADLVASSWRNGEEGNHRTTTSGVDREDMLLMLIVAGLEPIANLLTLCLFHHLAGASTIHQSPDKAKYADELIRYDTPVFPGICRYAVSAFKFGTIDIRAGDLLVLSVGAANRDAGAFPRPDRLDSDRERVEALSFGAGLHKCPGSVVSRTVIHEVLSTFITIRPRVRLLEPVEWTSGSMRVITKLWVEM